MAEIKIEIKNQTTILNAFRNAPNIFVREIQTGLGNLGRYVSKELIEKQVFINNEGGFPSPKDKPGQTPLWRTGAMVIHIGVIDTAPFKITIAPDYALTPYAEWVILGHRIVAWGHDTGRYAPPHPIFDILKNKHTKEIQDYMQLVLDKIVQKIANSIK